MNFVIAVIGAKALYLLYGWLASAIIANYLSERKGYGSKLGLALGLLLSIVGVVVMLLVPARRDSRWKLQGPFGSGGGKTVAEARAERDVEGS
jgi:fucose permease